MRKLSKQYTKKHAIVMFVGVAGYELYLFHVASVTIVSFLFIPYTKVNGHFLTRDGDIVVTICYHPHLPI